MFVVTNYVQKDVPVLQDNRFKIAVVYSTYPQLTEAAQEFVNRSNFHIEIKECVFDKALEEALKFQKRGFDLIISRGVTGALIKKTVNIPVVLVAITNFDILNTLYQAKNIGKKIAYFEYANPDNYHDFASIKKILGLRGNDITIYYFNNEKELREKVREAINDENLDVVVASGSFVLEMAKQQGKKSIMVHSSTEAIYNAFRQADEILQGRYSDRRTIKSFSSIFDYLKTGLIITDKKDSITHINSAAEYALSVTADKLLGCNLSKINIQGLNKLCERETSEEIVEFNKDDYLLKCIPLMVDDRCLGKAITLENIKRLQKTETNIRKRKNSNGLTAKYEFDDIIGDSAEIKKVIHKAKKYARSDSTILITGESGTGKEIFANSIHNYSMRANGPFVAINCAAIPDSLLESELFGYDEGAFTGAKKGGKSGLFELSHKGTIFLDEISEVSLPVQTRLLRVLQEKDIRRVGGSKVIPVDIRVIAATNADIIQKVKDGVFREDLYYRLNVFRIELPPLRKRIEDVPSLISFFLSKYSGDENKISDILMDKLKTYHWPGNVRELESFIEKYVILQDDDQKDLFLIDDLYDELSSLSNKEDLLISDSTGDGKIQVQIGSLKDMEEQIIRQVFYLSNEDKTTLARKLGVSRTTIWKKLKDM